MLSTQTAETLMDRLKLPLVSLQNPDADFALTVATDHSQWREFFETMGSRERVDCMV